MTDPNFACTRLAESDVHAETSLPPHPPWSTS